MVKHALLVVLLVTFIQNRDALKHERVPVLMWTDVDGYEFPEVLAGHTVTSDDFKVKYLTSFMSENPQSHLLLFVQDKLSVADITHYANVYGYSDNEDSFANVKSLMSDMPSTHLPNVMEPIRAFADLPPSQLCELSAPFDVDALNCDLISSSKVIVVKLPDIDLANKKTSFSDNDKLIGQISKALRAKTNQPILTIFTSKESSIAHVQRGSDYSVPGAPRRSLLATAESTANYTFINVSNEILFYTTNITLSMTGVTNGTQLDLAKLTADEDGSVCDNGTNANCTLILKYSGDLSEIKDLQFKFLFTKNKYNYWIISQLFLSYMNDTQSMDVEMNIAYLIMRAPIGFSFSCTSPPRIAPLNSTESSLGPFVTFEDFQVQAFGATGSNFGYYCDCEGFFTLGMWMVLITVFVLLTVLIFGICMLADITTMDRFDDPKGKTIIVTQATE